MGIFNFKTHMYRVSFTLHNGVKIVRYVRARKTSIAVEKAIEEISTRGYSIKDFSLLIERV